VASFRRDVDALASPAWDLLVVGGGVHGLFAAYDAAQRGLSVALIDAADFGSGLSFNHQRTLHGGLRALQTGHLAKTLRQIDERRTWARLAPHVIAPLPFLVGTYGWTTRSRLALKLGFALYDRLGRRRNQGIPTELHVPAARLQSRAATRRLFPGIVEDGLTGGATWYDYQTRHPDRLTWLIGTGAREAGATLVNYMQAVELLKSSDRISGATAQDAIDGSLCRVEAKVTLLAAGSGLGSLLRPLGLPAPPLLRAMNLLLDRPSRDLALAARGASGRMLTAVPWAGATLVGTSQSSSQLPDDAPACTAEDVDEFIGDLRVAFPSLDASRRDVRLVHAGLTPAAIRNGRAELLSEHRVIDHRHHRSDGSRGLAGLVSLVGVKYTTARWAAERAVDTVVDQLGRAAQPCRTARLPLPHGAIADVQGRLAEARRELHVELDDRHADHLAGWYGTEAPEVLRYLTHTGQFEPIASTSPVISGEIAYAVDHAGALRLSDAVFRRTPLGAAGHPGADALERAAAVMAQKLGWTPDRAAEEIRDVEKRYEVP
jgi:glycerol-3-phosphate dehydrogenase